MVLCILGFFQSDEVVASARAEATRIVKIAARTVSGSLPKWVQNPEWETERELSGAFSLKSVLARFYFVDFTKKVSTFRITCKEAKEDIISADQAESASKSFLREAFSSESRVRSFSSRRGVWDFVLYPVFRDIPFEVQYRLSIHKETGQIVSGSLPRQIFLPPSDVRPVTTAEEAEVAARLAIQREFNLIAFERTAGPTLFLSALSPIYQSENGFKDFVTSGMRTAAKAGQCFLVYKLTFAYNLNGKRTGIFVSVDAKTGKVLTLADLREGP